MIGRPGIQANDHPEPRGITRAALVERLSRARETPIVMTDSARRSSPCAARGDACLRDDACDAAEADVAGRGVDGLCLAGGGPVAQAVVGCAQM